MAKQKQLPVDPKAIMLNKKLKLQGRLPPAEKLFTKTPKFTFEEYSEILDHYKNIGAKSWYTRLCINEYPQKWRLKLLEKNPKLLIQDIYGYNQQLNKDWGALCRQAKNNNTAAKTLIEAIKKIEYYGLTQQRIKQVIATNNEDVLEALLKRTKNNMTYSYTALKLTNQQINSIADRVPTQKIYKTINNRGLLTVKILEDILDNKLVPRSQLWSKIWETRCYGDSIHKQAALYMERHELKRIQSKLSSFQDSRKLTIIKTQLKRLPITEKRIEQACTQAITVTKQNDKYYIATTKSQPIINYHIKQNQQGFQVTPILEYTGNTEKDITTSRKAWQTSKQLEKSL